MLIKIKNSTFLFVFVVALIFNCQLAFTQNKDQINTKIVSREYYKFDSNHVNILWQVDHFGFSRVSGKFTEVEGGFYFDPDLEKSIVDVVINTNSINTGIEKFDNHLRSADFFNVAIFPKIKFKSTRVEKKGDNRAKVYGLLTIKNIEKPISIDVRLNKIDLNPIIQRKTVGISATTKIKRSDFDIKFALPGVSDEVKINIEVEGNISEDLNKIAPDSVKANNQSNNNDDIKAISNWHIDKTKSKIEFSVKQGDSSVVTGKFNDFDGKLSLNKSSVFLSRLNIKVATDSVELNFSEANKILKSAEWLAVKQFAEARFVTTKVRMLNQDEKLASGAKLQIVGVLKIRGVSSVVDFTATIKELNGKFLIANAELPIKMSDFKISNNSASLAWKSLEDVVLLKVLLHMNNVNINEQPRFTS
jgi:polyisoprenoid-binding protein YceI